MNAERHAIAHERAHVFGVRHLMHRHKQPRRGAFLENFIERVELRDFSDGEYALIDRVADERLEQFLFSQINGDRFRARL